MPSVQPAAAADTACQTPPVLNPTVSAAVKLKNSLLDLAKKQADKRLRRHLNQLAALTRREFEGFTKNELRQILLEQFLEYSDGAAAQSLTVYDLHQLTELSKQEIERVLLLMLARGDIIETDRIPDFHQFGDHSKAAYALNLDGPRKRLHQVK